MEGMNLVLFDIDGTLTRTNAVSSECFVMAMYQVFQITDIDTDWTKYRDVTERGCFEEIIELHKGRPGTIDELSLFKTRYINLLRDHSDANGELFQPISGAGDILAMLKKRTDVAVTVATGAWPESANIKLRRSGLEIGQMLIATGNDSASRKKIIEIAESRAESANGGPFHTKTYVGDAVWDLQAASMQGFQFIGIGSGDRAEDLKTHGAKWIVPDFEQPTAFLRILEHIFRAEPDDTADPK